MSERGWEVASLEQIAGPRARHGYDWHPVRRHFGIGSFGANANVARGTGDVVVDEHDEIGGDGGQEELYVVLRGRALFTLNGEDVEVAAGTFLFVRDPAVKRDATALEPDTAVLAVGGRPGAARRSVPRLRAGRRRLRRSSRRSRLRGGHRMTDQPEKPHDKLQHLEKIRREIQSAKTEAERQGMAFAAPTEEELRRLLEATRTPLFTSVSWFSQAPPSGTTPVTTQIFNPDATTAWALAVQVLFGAANVIGDPAAALQTANQRMPQVMFPKNAPFNLAAGTSQSVSTTLHMPADALQGSYVVNLFLLQLSGFGTGSLLNRAQIQLEVT